MKKLIYSLILQDLNGFISHSKRLSSGIVSQRQTLTANSQCVLGCCLVAIGTLFLFPSPSFPHLYTSTHYSGYVAISLLGLGDPLVTNVTISNMERIQTELCGRRLTAHLKSSISSIWLMGWVGGMNFGMFLAGIFLDHLTFLQGACVVAGTCFLATAIFGILKLAFVLTREQSAETVQPGMDSVASCEIEYIV
jgi:MFS family permease